MFKEKISQVVKQMGTGQSVFQPTAYATAWVSRIPELNNLIRPAFPQAVHWLRANQLVEGGWGVDYPRNVFANTLCTLAALLALKQWDEKKDQEIIAKAFNALVPLAKELSTKEYKTFGFELILSALVEEFIHKNFELPKEALAAYEEFLPMGNSQREMLKAYQQQSNYQNPNIFWVCLEILGGVYLMNKEQPWPFSADLLAANGSLIGSVPAGAYFLAANRWRGHGLPSTFDYLNGVIAQNEGGAPPYHAMEQFEQAFCLDFFIKAGVPIDWLKPAIKQLYHHWQQRGGLGYSMYSPSLDVDDSALGLIILKEAGEDADYKPLLEFFNGEYFTHYQEDPTPSISVNANVLRALAYFKENEEVKTIMNKVLSWLQSILKNPLEKALQDTWHVSPYYAASAISFALNDLDPALNQRCSDWLIAAQRQDGGWGHSNYSTLEETALAILALTNQFNRGINISKECLIKAKNYIEKAVAANNRRDWLYMGSTTLCPALVVEANIIAAQYALSKTLSRGNS